MDIYDAVYVHTGTWPSPSPSIVFVTGTVTGLAESAKTLLIIKNGSENTTGEIYESLTGHSCPDSLDIERIGGKRPPGNAAFFRTAMRKLSAMAKTGTAGSVITRNIGFLPYLRYLKKRHGIPCFFETHDFFSDLTLRTDLKKTLKVKKNSLYEKLFFPGLDGVICLTHEQRRIITHHYPTVRTIVAPTGCMTVGRSEAKRENRICYVGSLDVHKGVGTVLDAMARMADHTLGLLVIGGKDEHEMREFMKLAALMNVEDRVRITGWVHHSDVGYMMDRCIAGVVPLNDTPFNRHLTSPLKILDCFSRSLPVIGADLPSVREYVDDGVHGLLFEPGDAESLAEALDRYTANSLFDTMSPAVEERARTLLYTERGKTILEFISK